VLSLYSGPVLAHSKCLACGSMVLIDNLKEHYEGHYGKEIKKRRSGAIRRLSHSVARKLTALSIYDSYIKSGHVSNPQLCAAKHVGVHESLISKWSVPDMRAKLLRKSIQRQGKQCKLAPGRLPQYPAHEAELFIRFYMWKVCNGLRVGDHWLKYQFTQILAEHGIFPKQISPGWLSRFKRRFRITSQVITNKHASSVADRLPQIQNFHRYILFVQNRGIQRDERYGRYPPTHMFHFDQIPLPFVMNAHKSLNIKGFGTNRVATLHTTGLDKRQATIHLCIRAEGEQFVKPAIIFRGLGKALTQAEWDEYAKLTNIRVYFQANAWCDGQTMCKIAKGYGEDFFAAHNSGECVGETLFGADQHKPQMSEKFIRFLKHYTKCGDYVYTPANCTDCTAPCDHHIGGNLKAIIRQLYELELEMNFRTWTSETIPASHRRILMAQWLSETWAIFRNRKEFIRKAFVSTGWLQAKDGSEQHLIKLQGLNAPYHF
jgi:hypothetical protein